MYSRYFGFSTPPFGNAGNNAGDKVFFDGAAHRAALSCLQAGIGKRGGVLLFTGAAGAGKTLLLRRLTSEMDRTQIRCITVWDARIGFQSLLERLYGALELPFSENRPREGLEVMGRLLAKGTRFRHYALIVDDAQQLPEETLQGLQQLARLESGGQKLLRVVLSGVPSLTTRLGTEPPGHPLFDQVDSRCQLDGLEDDEVQAYVEQRLRASGYAGPPLFEEGAIRKIAAHARGVPRLVNRICDQTLLLAYLHSERQGHAKWVRPVAIQSQSFEPLTEKAAAPMGHGIPSAPFPAVGHRQDSPPKGASEDVTVSPPPPKVLPPDKADKAPSVPDIHSDPPALETPLADFPHEPLTAPPAMALDQVPHMATDPIRYPRPAHRTRRSWFLMGLFVIFLIAVAAMLSVHYFPVRDGEPPRFTQLGNALESLLTHLQDMSSSATEPAKAPEPSPQTAPAMATDAAASPQPSLATGNDRAPAETDPVSALLDKADEQMGELNYIHPDADNALESYHAVLRLDPDNADALLGIERIKSGFVLWSGAAQARGELGEAENYLKSALMVDPDDEALREKLDIIRQARKETENAEPETGGDAK